MLIKSNETHLKKHYKPVKSFFEDNLVLSLSWSVPPDEINMYNFCNIFCCNTRNVDCNFTNINLRPETGAAGRRDGIPLGGNWEIMPGDWNGFGIT